MNRYDLLIKDGHGYRFCWVGTAENIADAVKTAMQAAAMSGALSSDIVRDEWPVTPISISVSKMD